MSVTPRAHAASTIIDAMTTSRRLIEEMVDGADEGRGMAGSRKQRPKAAFEHTTSSSTSLALTPVGGRDKTVLRRAFAPVGLSLQHDGPIGGEDG